MDFVLLLILGAGTGLILLAGLAAIRANKPKPTKRRATRRSASRKKSRATAPKTKGKSRRIFGDDEDMLQTFFETALGDKRKR